MSFFRNSFFKWGSSSLIGHIVLVETFSAIPIAIAFLSVDDSALTVLRVLRVALIFGAYGIAAGAALWYTVSLPLMKRRSGR